VLKIIALLTVITAAVAQDSGYDASREIWRSLKARLSASDGEVFFEKELKGALVPRLKGTVVSASLNEGVSKMILALTDSVNAEVTLLVQNGSKKLKKPPAGKLLIFEGVSVDFTKQPFMLTMDVEWEHIDGLKVEN
jgi:hypothetical protein